MRKMRKVVKIAVTLILTLSMVLGSYVGVFAANSYAQISDTLIYLNYHDTYDLDVDDKVPGDSYYIDDIHWSSADPNIAAVNANGNVIAKNVTGETIITVTYKIYRQRSGPDQLIGEYTETCIVRVGKFYTISHIDVDKTGFINYTINTDGVVQSTGSAGATVTNIQVSLNGTPLTVNQNFTTGEARAAVPGGSYKLWELETITVTATLTATINGVVVTSNYSETFDTKAEFDALKAACPDHSGFDVVNPTGSATIDYYTATFIYDNGSAPTTDTYLKGSDIIKPADPIKADMMSEGVKVESYVFAGWLEEDASLTETDDFLNITAPRTFTASYTVTEFNTVTFKDWDGTTLNAISEIQDGNYLLGTDIPDGLTKADDTSTPGMRTEFTFEGWDDFDTPEIESYTNDEVVAMAINTNRTFIAVYAATDYFEVMFYDGNGIVIGVMEEVQENGNVTSVPDDANKDETNNLGIRTVFDFNGKWEDEDGNIYTSVEVATLAIIESKVFVALFDATEYYTITFYEEDGLTYIDDREVAEGGNLSDFPAAEGKEDSVDGLHYYTFDQWVDMDGNPVSFEGIANPMEVKALYIENNYIVVSFYVQLPDDTLVLINTQYILPDGDADDPGPGWMEENDYILGDWDGILTGIEEDTTLTARAATVAGEQEENRLLVRFYVQMPDGTKVLIDAQSVLYGDDAKDPAAVWMAANNYTLGAWNGSLNDIMKDTDFTARAAVVAGAAEVQTGDTVPIVSMSILLAAAAFSIVFVTSKKRKDA